jgi:hypothetical protein
MAQATDHKRRLRHVLHAAGQDKLAFAQQEALRGLRDRFNSGAAKAVHSHRGSLGF